MYDRRKEKNPWRPILCSETGVTDQRPQHLSAI